MLKRGGGRGGGGSAFEYKGWLDKGNAAMLYVAEATLATMQYHLKR